MISGLGATIFALATPAGRGAVAVVRLSGPQALAALERLTRTRLPKPRRVSLRRLYGPDGEGFDDALVVAMPGPGSYTGEDCVELHLHGGPAVVAGVLDLLRRLDLRPAEAGEFTRRAFENSRLDLAQAEAIGDLVEAESGAQRRQALAQLGGALSRRYDGWRETLLDALAMLEAEIDFPDEDVSQGVGSAAAPKITDVRSQLEHAARRTEGERVREGFRIALLGAPNVGKSSLLNALVGRDAAIVTDMAGTTRDVVEVALSIGGQLVILADTAGLRQTSHVVEVEGVRRARLWAETADIRVGVVDRTRPETQAVAVAELRSGDILAFNKSDLFAGSDHPPAPLGILAVSTVADESDASSLYKAIANRLAATAGATEFPAVTRLRHRALLDEGLVHLRRAEASLSAGPELAAEDVRLAIRTLEKVAGRSDPEAVLDRVFSSFCIGK